MKKQNSKPFASSTNSVFHLDAIFGSLLQVRYDGVVPQIDEPLPELCHWYWAGQEEAGTYMEGKVSG